VALVSEGLRRDRVRPFWVALL